MVFRSCAPMCRSLLQILDIYVGDVRLRWDDDVEKSRIECLGCECKCLWWMKGLSIGVKNELVV